jgi:hypothetical protein
LALLLPGSVDKGATEAERKKYLEYGLEELAVILATNGTKISHRNEARYDITAAVIQNIEVLLRAADPSRQAWPAPDLFEQVDERELLLAFDEIVGAFLNKIKKDSLAQTSKLQPTEQEAYWSKALNLLGVLKNSLKRQLAESKIPKNERGKILQRDKVYDQYTKIDPATGQPKKQLIFNFGVAQANARSFGWQDSGERASMGFREPYSTYFYRSGAELFLNSDQVVAVPDGQIAGKILALDQRTQLQYANEVVKPLLQQYFKQLERAPQAYFNRVGKSRRQLLDECESSASLIELLEFVQKYVVAPAAERSGPQRAGQA